MEKEKIIICDVEITEAKYPGIWGMAKNNPERLKQQIDSIVAVEHKKGNTKFTAKGALAWLSHDFSW